MPSPFKLPPKVAERVAPLKGVGAGTLRSVLHELEPLEPSLRFQEDVEAAIGRSTLLGDRSEEEKSELAEAITGVHILQYATRQSAKTLIAELVSVSTTTDSDPNELTALEENLQAVLSVRTLRASAKAWLLLGEQERLYIGSGVISDIRPVFDDAVTDPLLASVVTHTIKITVSKDDRRENYYIAADIQDLTELKEAIERAIGKDRILKEAIEKDDRHLFGLSIKGG